MIFKKKFNMTQQEQQTHFEKLVDVMRATMLKKGNDYANDVDRLINFKAVGFICGTDAERACLTLIATKVARLTALLNSRRAPDNESVEDTMVDLCCYSVLLHAIRSEQKQKPSQPIKTETK